MPSYTSSVVITGIVAGKLLASTAIASDVGWKTSCEPKNAAAFTASNSACTIAAEAVS